MATTTITGDLHVKGIITMDAISMPRGVLANRHFTNEEIDASKCVHRYQFNYAQASDAAPSNESRVVHVAQAAGVIRAFSGGCIVAETDLAKWVEFDLLVNGVTVLVAPIEIGGSTDAQDREPQDGTIRLITYDAGDIFEIDISDLATVIAEGAFCRLVLDENPA